MFFPRQLFDDGEYVLEIGWFGLGALYASSPVRTVRATKFQRAIFLDACEGFTRAGGVLEPGNARAKMLMRDFCELVVTRPMGGLGWQLILNEGPSSWGSRYASEVP